MDCPVCGKPYGITHECTGPVDRESQVPVEWRAPEGVAAIHYLRQAIAIVRWDEGAIMGAAFDGDAIPYGMCIWFVGQVLLFVGSYFSQPARVGSLTQLAVGSVILIVLGGILMLGQYGACHLLARWWFGARGTYLGLLRPLLLGSIVTWLGVMPYIGLLTAGIGSVAVMMIVFEEVDGIGRLQAFGLSLVLGLLSRAILSGLLSLLR